MAHKIGIIYMDLSKAIDSLNLELLIAKLKFDQLDQNAIAPFRSYISNHYQWCKIKIIGSVLQGSILGPLIFNEFSILFNWLYDNYMVLNSGTCHFMLLGVKENDQFDLICHYITLKYSSHKKILGVTIDNKLSLDEDIINICKTIHKKLNALSRINHYMEQNQKEILLSSFIIPQLS